MADDPLWGEQLTPQGETLRDRFAGQAMQGMLSCQDFMNEAIKCAESKDEARPLVAYWAYRMADAMLLERTKGKEQS